MTKPKNKEIERKFLVDIEKWSPSYPNEHILQFYLSDNPTVRIRLVGFKQYKSLMEAYVTIKGPTKKYNKT